MVFNKILCINIIYNTHFQSFAQYSFFLHKKSSYFIDFYITFDALIYNCINLMYYINMIKYIIYKIKIKAPALGF